MIIIQNHILYYDELYIAKFSTSNTFHQADCFLVVVFVLLLIILHIYRQNIFVTSERNDYYMKNKVLAFSFFSICSLLLSSCSKYGNTSNQTYINESPVAMASNVETTIRYNTAVVLTPKASNITVYQNDLACIDASNVSEGYIMVKYKGNNRKVKLQITGPSSITYTYNLHSGFETFPLSSGSGSYSIAIYENVTGNQYSTAFAKSVNVQIVNEFGPYLYPNQYVNFTASCQTVAKGEELAANATSDLEVVSNVYNYIINNISYDYNKANTVQSGYTSNVDDILNKRTGICLDYSAVMASMLRSQGIPTRLEVGYAADAYHAWISTYIKDIGWVNGIIEFDGKGWKIMDPTFAASTSERVLKNFIGNGSNYVTKYIY